MYLFWKCYCSKSYSCAFEGSNINFTDTSTGTNQEGVGLILGNMIIIQKILKQLVLLQMVHMASKKFVGLTSTNTLFNTYQSN